MRATGLEFMSDANLEREIDIARHWGMRKRLLNALLEKSRRNR